MRRNLIYRKRNWLGTVSHVAMRRRAALVVFHSTSREKESVFAHQSCVLTFIVSALTFVVLRAGLTGCLCRHSVGHQERGQRLGKLSIGGHQRDLPRIRLQGLILSRLRDGAAGHTHVH